MLPIDGDLLREVMPRTSGNKATSQKRIVEAVSGSLQSTLSEYQIDTPLRIAHFIAQIAHESDGFCTTQEYASGAAYEGRSDLGNNQPGDGKRFKGRGLLQLTGRANYRRVGGIIGIDLEKDPERAADPATSLVIACEYWKNWRNRGINPLCDRDDLIAVTKAVNGGLRGLDDRRHYLGRAKTAIARIGGIVVGAGQSPSARPVLRRGSRGAPVAELQALLRKNGYPIATDGDFGPATETVVKHFQTRKKLTADGIVGQKTWDALGS
ncbi:MAG: peptidoglycan-binding protein [Parasphingopyxis sp.]|nr:peptidoglycan-binding protein [Sphingomonadales bacterium]